MKKHVLSEGDGPTVTNELSRAGSGGGEREGEFHGYIWLVKFWKSDLKDTRTYEQGHT